jgi:RNA recognition motif-containing protein
MMENLPFQVCRIDVLDYIGRATGTGAAPIDIKACCSKTGHPSRRNTGVGFVEMKSHESAMALILGHGGVLLNGRIIKVTRAWPNAREEFGAICDMVDYPTELLVPPRAVGTLMGKGGEFIEAVKARHNVLIQGPHRDDERKVFTFQGTPAAVENALLEYQTKLQEWVFKEQRRHQHFMQQHHQYQQHYQQQHHMQQQQQQYYHQHPAYQQQPNRGMGNGQQQHFAQQPHYAQGIGMGMNGIGGATWGKICFIYNSKHVYSQLGI